MVKTSRHFRLDDEVYAAAQAKARREYTTVTALIERYLAVYTGLMGDDGVEAAAKAAPKIAESKPRAFGYSKQQQARGKKP